MKTLLLPLLFICGLASAQKQLQNLHYNYTKTLKNNKGTQVKYNWFNFNIDGNVMAVTTQSPEGTSFLYFDKSGTAPSQIFDLDKQFTVMLTGDKKSFILEEMKLYPVDGKLLLNGGEEEKEINGYKCKCYRSPLDKAQGAGIKIWVTTDLAVNNEALNPLILGTLSGGSYSNFKGVVVKIETQSSWGDNTWVSTTELDPSAFEDERPKITMPWDSPQPATALLEPPVNASEGCTGEFPVGRHKRMKEFLEKTLGNIKVKTKNTTEFLPCHIWN